MGLAAERKELHKTIRELLDIDKEIEQERQASLLKGKAEGKAEGKLEALKKTARQMKGDGMPIDVIRKYTGLSQKELSEL